MKQRHGCLTAWLVLMIIFNSVTMLMNLIAGITHWATASSVPVWAFPVLAIMGLVNVVCSIALLYWKKWGFFGIVATAAVTFAVNLSLGVDILQALIGVAGVILLYGVLQIGHDNKGWAQLE